MGDRTDVGAAPRTPLDWRPPDDGPEPLVAPLAVVPRREASSGWRVAAIIGLVIAGLLVAAIVLLWQKVDDLSADTTQTRSRVTDARGVAASVSDLEQSVDELQGSVQALKDATGAANTDVATRIAALQARADALTGCINTYMDALAGWTRNIAATFVYTPC